MGVQQLQQMWGVAGRTFNEKNISFMRGGVVGKNRIIHNKPTGNGGNGIKKISGTVKVQRNQNGNLTVERDNTKCCTRRKKVSPMLVLLFVDKKGSSE